MLTAYAVFTTGNYEKYYTATVFDSEVRKTAESLFDEYVAGGVIIGGCFSGEEWLFSNQLQTMTVSFHFSQFDYHKNTKPWIGCDYRLFVDSVKIYVMLKMGTASIISIRDVVNRFRLLVETPRESWVNQTLEYHTHIREFLAALPSESPQRDAILEVLEESEWSDKHFTGKSRQRVLSELPTYFKFNDALQDLWKTADNTEKLFWFPLYFWWTLTAILPLRTTEFLLTPRDCLSCETGQSLITLRRSLLKGGGRKLAYRIDKDYEIVRYAIPNKMAQDITWYLNATKTMTPTTIGTLFVREPHYSYMSKEPYGAMGYYTYANLSTCLRYFQEKVMKAQEGTKIHLGDTRHLAMISIILSGGSPLVCKELAGHADINISAHYYSNISAFIECATFEAHRKSRVWSVELAERNTLPQVAGKRIPVQNGFCTSEVYIKGEIYDCIKSISIDGEIARVFPRRTNATPDDALAFTGPPPKVSPDVDEVHVSVTFTYDMPKAEQLAEAWAKTGLPVKLGGPALGEPGGDFTPGLYLRQGYVLTSRGCPNSCWFCSVPVREGDLRELPVTEGANVLDDNLLACSEAHIRAVFEMLKRQPERPAFTGGLEAKRLKAWHVQLLREVKTRRMYFAYDTVDDLDPLINAGKLLRDGGFTKASHTAKCYVLIGYERVVTILRVKRLFLKKRLYDLIHKGQVVLALFYTLKVFAELRGRFKLKHDRSPFQRQIRGKRNTASPEPFPR